MNKQILLLLSIAGALLLLTLLNISTKPSASPPHNIQPDTLLNTADSQAEQQAHPLASNNKQANSAADRLEPDIHRAVNAMTDASSEGLTEEKTKHGYVVNLEGRFQYVPVATVSDSGEVIVRDYSSAPAQEE